MIHLKRTFSVVFLLLAGLFFLAESASAAGCYFYSQDVSYVCDSDPELSIFVEPQKFPDSPLDRAMYARLKDYTRTDGGTCR